jgi:hypothetical protein
MSEPQVPGQLRGMPAEGTYAPQIPGQPPGYTEGPTPNMAPYAPTGNPTVNQTVPQQRDTRGQREARAW